MQQRDKEKYLAYFLQVSKDGGVLGHEAAVHERDMTLAAQPRRRTLDGQASKRGASYPAGPAAADETVLEDAVSRTGVDDPPVIRQGRMEDAWRPQCRGGNSVVPSADPDATAVSSTQKPRPSLIHLLIKGVSAASTCLAPWAALTAAWFWSRWVTACRTSSEGSSGVWVWACRYRLCSS